MAVPSGFDLTSARFFADSFPTLERLRTEAPVYFFEPLQCFIITALPTSRGS
jgi:hypothetical protein